MAKGIPAGPTGNRLLNLVPAEELHNLLPRMQKLTLAAGQVQYEVREPIEYVYFPLNCALSAVIVMRNGTARGSRGCPRLRPTPPRRTACLPK